VLLWVADDLDAGFVVEPALVVVAVVAVYVVAEIVVAVAVDVHGEHWLVIFAAVPTYFPVHDRHRLRARFQPCDSRPPVHNSLL
jgi:hypothetical protein